MALKVRSDWLVKLRLPLRNLGKMACRFASEEIIQLNFCGVYYLTVLVYAKTIVHLSVGS